MDKFNKECIKVKRYIENLASMIADYPNIEEYFSEAYSEEMEYGAVFAVLKYIEESFTDGIERI